MKLMLGSLLGLLAFGLSSANAQFSPFYNPPVTNPLQTPFFNPYNPFTPFSFYGNPAVRQYAGMQGVPGGYGGAGTTGVVVAQSLGDPSMTGHPTRFFSYSQYFFNQGGSLTTGTGAPADGTTPAVRPGGAAAVAIGTAPLRGRSNTGSTK